MHELSICRAIVDIVDRHAEGRPVQTVHLQVGMLRQIVPATLSYCWTLVTAGSSLESATLEVEHVPATARCPTCGHTAELETQMLVCNACASDGVEIITGEEFLITSLELTEV
ncbi:MULTISPECIES: hydrogenase maturation nickel metallochaperone HypA [Pseudonocardia]|uniref:Hydrogenase maturation factor HypA n=1 Tax=Pseudonocardia autotrophica TaxID=2074 RepID=A0A1Y2MH28_PSEAH|nr:MULTISPECIES: hydrogenase maturation nickel metallochaperone HypA [Pseudonocardia]OSY34462.1 hydrogenase nickel incorporation protein [Pseudonocardia autotrophica]TDN76402.1 hydrogenase-3 nickel incorporation protein HypA [Pseudonocardia autotrophica]